MLRNSGFSTKSSRAFTFLELLVVLGVFVFFVSIAVSFTNESDANAKKLRCASQMRQFALAAFMYSADNGHLPYYGWAFDPSNGHMSDRQLWEKVANSYWFNTLGVYMQTGVEVDFDTKLSDTTLDLRRCPSSVDEPGGQCSIGVIYGSYPKAPFGYEYSGDVSRIRYRFPEVRLENIDNPSEWILFADSRITLVYSPNEWALTADADGDGRLDSNYGVLRTNRVPYNGAQPKIHNNGMNVTLCDGHVEWFPSEEIWDWDRENNRMTHQYWRQGCE